MHIRKSCLLLLAVFFILPAVLVLSGTIISRYELDQCLAPMVSGMEGFISWKFFPRYPTFEHYSRVLFYTPQFFVVFWNSMKIVVLVLAGQLLLAVPAAWAFAIYRFRFRKVMFTLYVVLMLMPFQVTMLSNYLVLDGLNLINTHGAIIFPAIFSTFPVFLIYRGFCALPEGIIDAARVDGAGMGDLLEDRTPSFLQRHPVGHGIGLFGILESHGAAIGISGGQKPVAPVPVFAGNQS